eukprot:g13565.t1
MTFKFKLLYHSTITSENFYASTVLIQVRLSSGFYADPFQRKALDTTLGINNSEYTIAVLLPLVNTRDYEDRV